MKNARHWMEIVALARFDGRAIVILDSGENMARVRFVNESMQDWFLVHYDNSKLTKF